MIGLASISENDYQVAWQEDMVLSKMPEEDGLLRFDYKKKFAMDKLVRFVDLSIGNGRVIQIKTLCKVREVVKTVDIALNIYFLTQKNTFTPLFKVINLK